jgi:hypothetical protein
MLNRKVFVEKIDQLAVAKGEKHGKVYHLTVTTGELIEAFGLKPSLPHHRHIKGLVEMHYYGTTSELVGRGDGADGFRLHLRIRSI